MKKAFEEIDAALCNTRPDNFFQAVGAYLHIVKRMDACTETFCQIEPSLYRDQAVQRIRGEASCLVSHAVILMKTFMEIVFQESSYVPRTRFRKLKLIQVESLSFIIDETEIIENMVSKSQKFRQMLSDNLAVLQKSNQYMEIMKERLENRPSTLLSVHGKDEKIKALNNTITNMQTYEASCMVRISKGMNGSVFDNSFIIYKDLENDHVIQIHKSLKSIENRFDEIKTVFGHMKRIAKKGFTRRIQNQIEPILENHQRRRHDFEKSVQLCRMEYANN